MFARSLFINLPLLQSIPKRELLLLLFSETWRVGGGILKMAELKGSQIPLCPLNKTLCIDDANFDAPLSDPYTTPLKYKYLCALRKML